MANSNGQRRYNGGSALSLTPRDGARMFTLDAFVGITTGLTGAERAEVFSRLPDQLQEQALREKGERIDQRSRLLWEESR